MISALEHVWMIRALHKFWCYHYYLQVCAIPLQSDLQKGVVIKTYIVRLISLPASCVFYFTRQFCLKINTLSHARSWKYGKYSAYNMGYGTQTRYIFPYFTRACVITYIINMLLWKISLLFLRRCILTFSLLVTCFCRAMCHCFMSE